MIASRLRRVLLPICAVATVFIGTAHAQNQTEIALAEPGAITNPVLLTDASPEFPALALEKRMEAEVVLSLTIAADGAIESVWVAEVQMTSEEGDAFTGEDSFGFRRAALVAGNQLKFRPAEYGGAPVTVTVNYTYRFRLPAKLDHAAAKQNSQPSELEPIDSEDAPEVINLEGTFLERGSRSYVAAVQITVYKGEGDSAQGFETTTDKNGHFAFYDLEPGTWHILTERTGYIPYKTTEVVAAGEVVTAKYYIERGSYSPYDVTVEAERSRKEVSRRRIGGADIEKVPGTLGDPVLVIENLPGVARSSISEIIVRGSGPNDTGVFVDGTRIPFIYHLGGLKSIFPAKIIDSIDFYPGNFSVAYGRAMGGVLDLHVKKLDPDRFHGSIDVSVLDTSVYLEMPVTDKLAVGLAGRRSYVDYVLSAVIPDDAEISLTQAPSYYDYQFFGSYRPTAKHDFRWLVLGSNDKMELLFDEPGANVSSKSTSSSIAASTNVKRLTLEHRYTPNADMKNYLKLSVGQDLLNFGVFGVMAADTDNKLFSARDTFTTKVAERFTLDVGFDLELERINGKIAFPPLDREGEPDREFDDDSVIETNFDDLMVLSGGPYIEGELKLGNVTLVPGLRADYFGLTKSWSMDPRLVARYDADSWAIKGGAAVVHQDPYFPDIDKVFGNPELELQRAYQYSVGAEWSPADHLKADVTLFYKDMQDLVGSSADVVTRGGELVPEKIANNTTGRVYGAEVFLEHGFSDNFRGWVSYTLSRAERKDPGHDEYRLFDYDQTHILAMVGSYTLPRNWEVGIRWRYVTGNLDTPVVGSVFNNDRNAYTPIYGEVNSARVPAFHQLDLRADKTWIFDTWKLSGYLSLINSYNRSNVEDVNHNFDYSEKGHTTGFPLLPILGVKGEW